MEQLITYFIKSSGLIALFYLAYHFLVRKETFFNGNRWFLLSGLVTSLILPLYFIEKTKEVIIQINPVQDSVMPPQPISITPEVTAVEAFDWTQLLWMGYLIISCVLVLKIVLNLISLYRMLRKQQITKKEEFKLINLNDNIAPFSFFNYIVYNSDLYSDTEMQSILLHEKIHCKGKHSIDVLVAEILCAIFWFNPFLWLYKKAMTQNLEYIADQKAIEQADDKKSYQHALLKVVSNQNCLPITNNFYQSLIKKRIVMLNKNQSHRRNSLKYAVIVPALIGFVFLFQVKTIAHNKFITTPVPADLNNEAPTNEVALEAPAEETQFSTEDVTYVFDKISSDKELDENAKDLKETHNIDLVFSNLKRNSNNEIISIKISYNDHKGNKGKVEQNRTIPIRPIFFKVDKSKDGKNIIGFYDNPELVEKPYDTVNENKITTIESIKDDALIYVDGDRYTKSDLNELDTKGLEKIEILKDDSSLAKYGAKSKGEVIVITTNWNTRQNTPKPAVNIITIANGDEVTVYDRFNMKVPGYPSVQFTETSPVLIYNGKPQSNPRLALESMPLSKIKDIKVLNDKDAEVKGTPIHKVIITTK